tara:strand:- start:269 stop:481 length:213 start_codon:yes stop_codon:yes gene_type:complete
MERTTVKRYFKGVNKVREGRGYSLVELREVDLDRFKAIRQGIPFDKFRKTKHEENIKKLNIILGKSEDGN